MIKPLFLLVLSLGLEIGPATALPCTLTTIRSEFWRYHDRPEEFVLVQGSFSDLEFQRHERRKDRSIWRATFTGFSPSVRGFDRRFAAEVTLVDRLFTGLEGSNPDPKRLASVLPGVTGLVFLKRTNGRYSLETEFCAPILFTDPADVKTARDCLAGRRCPRD